MGEGWWGGAEVKKKDEITVIGETFKRAMTENKELNEQLVRSQLKERESELKVLQAQIKPHFLYNTLDSIYWMAVLEGNENIAKMASSLAETFKLSLSKGKDSIPISEELSHIQHYMTIQNIRYQDKFKYIQQVDESLMDKHMLKLLLQPLVENAVYHGLELKVGPGTIWLTGKREGNEIVFTVEDDGVGIADMEETKKGFGLQNVSDRLSLFYGALSSLTITSNKGTKVEIRFTEKPREAVC